MREPCLRITKGALGVRGSAAANLSYETGKVVARWLISFFGYYTIELSSLCS
jgi:hypothetical protein